MNCPEHVEIYARINLWN